MHQLQTHPGRTLGVLLAIAFVLFMCSGIPALKDATHGLDFWLGNVVWWGFLLSALTFIAGGVLTVIRNARRGDVA